MNTPFNRAPLRICEGIPVFSERNEYTNNYSRIAADHISNKESGKGNPFVTSEQTKQVETITKELIAKHCTKNDRIIDVGIGFKSIVSDMLEFERHGVDISLEYLKLARQSGIFVILSLIEELPYADKYFDAIIACDVLEHVLHIDQCVEQLFRILRPGGIFIVRVPNEENLESYLNEGNPYKYVHLRNFNLASLRLYFEKIFKFELLEYRYCGKVFNINTQLKIRMPSKSSEIHKVIRNIPNEIIEADILRRLVSLSEEEIVDTMISLKEKTPKLFEEIFMYLINPVEIALVLKKPSC
jgi:ubiquinone/menaquinone biosynthesis C-methylase UbiE